MKFNELNKEQQEKAIENNRNIQVDYGEWAEGSLELLKTDLENLGYEDPTISYSGFWSQGDGASFTCKNIDIDKVLERAKIKTRFELGYELLFWKMYLKITRDSSRYFHENTVSVTDFDYGETGHKFIDLELAKYYTQLQDFIMEEVQELSRKIYEHLKEDYEYQTSDDEVRKYLIANDYDFDIETKI